MQAFDLRRKMAQSVLTESEYRRYLSDMDSDERAKFFKYYDNPELKDLESFIEWMKKMDAFK